MRLGGSCSELCTIMKYTANRFEHIAKDVIVEPRVPFHRCYRPLVRRINSGATEYDYLNDDDYAKKPYLFTRAFEELQDEIKVTISH